MSALRLAIAGAAGRMGASLVEAVRASSDLALVGCTARQRTPPGVDRSDVFVHLADLVRERAPQVVIDFTSPEASVRHAKTCADAKVPLVIGTTGFSDAEQRALDEAAKAIGIVIAPNTSIGVNVVMRAVAELAQRLADFEVEVVELHHRQKKDAPSGTALRLAEEVAKARGQTRGVLRTAREGQVGARPHTEIGVQSVRGGDVVGEHTVFFFGDGERVELTHRATRRDIFANGALKAARWLVRQPPGRYGMDDVLGFSVPGFSR